MITRQLGHRLRLGASGAALGCGLLVFLLLASDRWFTIRNIEISGDQLQVSVDGTKLPHNLFFFPSGKIRAQLLKDNPVLADVEFQKKFPDTLIIVASKRQPLAGLSTQNKLVWLIDPAGIIIDQALDTEKLPGIISQLATATIGETVSNPSIKSALGFLEAAQSKIAIDRVEILDESSLLAKSGKTDILIPQLTSWKSLVDTLQTMLAGFRIKGTLPSRIDLRFDKPVIVF